MEFFARLQARCVMEAEWKKGFYVPLQLSAQASDGVFFFLHESYKDAKR
jgi:hypothetical protein